MRLTHRARRKFPEGGVTILALLAVLTYGQAKGFGTIFLDLTKPVPEGEEVTRLPGASIGTVGGQRVPAPYLLPLAVELLSISPEPLRMGEKLTVEVLLRNTGDSVFLLPASRNKATVLKQGNQRRRTFLFLLSFEDPKDGRQISQVMVTADGSQNVPASWVRLEPGQRLKVAFAGNLSPFAEWLKPDQTQVRVRAQVSEWKYEDKRFFIESDSAPVTSANDLMLDLVPFK